MQKKLNPTLIPDFTQHFKHTFIYPFLRFLWVTHIYVDFFYTVVKIQRSLMQPCHFFLRLLPISYISLIIFKRLHTQKMIMHTTQHKLYYSSLNRIARAFTLTILGLLLTLPTFAQKNKSTQSTSPQNNENKKNGPIPFFDKKSYDYGDLDEDMKYATHKFEFTNIGDQNLFINNVVSSCGCTTPNWTRDSIPPGGKGFIETKYETINRLGKFKKTVTVYTNSQTASIIYLDIEGNVIKPQTTIIGAPLPQTVGGLFFDKGSVVFEPLYDNRADTQYIKLHNTTLYTTNFTPLNPDDYPKYVQILNFPSALEPNEFAKIKVIIDGTKAPGYGFGAFQIPVLSDNVVTPAMGLNITYSRKQYFPKYTAKQLAQQPKLSIKNPMHDFGSQISGDYLYCDYEFTNTGKKELEIKQVSADCPCFRLKFPKMKIAPGETIVVQGIFDTVTKNGAKTIGCEIVSNDPSSPSKWVYVKAQFQQKFKSCPTCH